MLALSFALAQQTLLLAHDQIVKKSIVITNQ